MKIQMLGFCVLCLALAGCFDESNVCETSGVSTTTTASGGAGGEGGAGGSGGSACPFESECDPAAPNANLQCKDTDHLTSDHCIDTMGCGGICAHVPVECDATDTTEAQKLVCDDGNGCTIDRCDPLNFCTHVACPPPPECQTAACFNEICATVPVEDGTACGVSGTCFGGQCSE